MHFLATLATSSRWPSPTAIGLQRALRINTPNHTEFSRIVIPAPMRRPRERRWNPRRRVHQNVGPTYEVWISPRSRPETTSTRTRAAWLSGNGPNIPPRRTSISKQGTWRVNVNTMPTSTSSHHLLSEYEISRLGALPGAPGSRVNRPRIARRNITLVVPVNAAFSWFPRLRRRSMTRLALYRGRADTRPTPWLPRPSPARPVPTRPRPGDASASPRYRRTASTSPGRRPGSTASR